MKIVLNKISKKYKRETIFKGVDYTFESGCSYVIKGSNGSGKSTLLSILSGSTLPSSGTLNYINKKEEAISQELFYQEVSVAAPYLELIEEYELKEFVDFYRKFKTLRDHIDTKKLIEICYLEKSSKKQIKFFSSGMKQRLRLALAILSDTKILLLDEPISNLDQKGIEWYGKLIKTHASNRVIIVCSNNLEQEHFFCTHEIIMEDYK